MVSRKKEDHRATLEAGDRQAHSFLYLYLSWIDQLSFHGIFVASPNTIKARTEP